MDSNRPHVLLDGACSFCAGALTAPTKPNELLTVACPCCGTYRITASAADVVPHWHMDEWKWAALFYQLRRMTDRAVPPTLDTRVLKELKESVRLPHADQILDDFVIWLGSKSRWPGETCDLGYETHRAVLGAVDGDAFSYMVSCIDQSHWFTGIATEYTSGPSQMLGCTLSPDGWQRFRDLSASKAGSKHAFMAMRYGADELDAIVRDHFVPQVKLAGFDLQRLDDGQPAGLIDDQLRVRIRRARFMVCDLTHGNRGAYWEAGFAEGLGLPVIYTCRRDVFDDKTHTDHPHFDTNHLVTVPWEPGDPAAAAQKLKSIVRATLPAEAQLADV